MIALPKAMSQGSNGGGGATLALTGMSAARAEPEIIASAVANKITFFILIPITFQEPARFKTPPGLAIPGCKSNSLTRLQSGTRPLDGEAKNAGICRLFVRLSDSTKGCWEVWHSNNNFGHLMHNRHRQRISFHS